MQPFYHLQSIKNVFLMERLTGAFHQNSLGRLCLEKKQKKPNATSNLGKLYGNFDLYGLSVKYEHIFQIVTLNF